MIADKVPQRRQYRSVGRSPGEIRGLAGDSRGEARIAFLVAVLATISIVVFAVSTIVTSRQDTLTAEQNNLSNISLTLSQHIQRVVFSADIQVAYLQEIVDSEKIRNSADLRNHAWNPGMFHHLQDLVVHATDIEALALADGDGNMMSSRIWPPPAVNVADRDYFISLQSGNQQVISHPIKSRLTGQEIVILGRRIENRDSEFLGIAFATLSTHRFSKLFSDVSRNLSSASMILLHHDGVALTELHNTPASPVLKGDFLHDLIGKVANSDEYNGTLNGNESLLVSVNNVAGYPLSMVVARPVDVVLEQWRNYATFIILFTTTAITMVWLATWAFSRLIRARSQLSASYDKLAHSNRRLKEAQHYARLGQWEMDMVTREFACTPEVYQLLDRPASTGIKYRETLLSLAHPDDRQALQNAHAKSLQTNTPYEIAFRLQAGDGGTRYMIERGHYEYGDSGEPVYAAGSLQDISDLRAAEDELRRARNSAETARQMLQSVLDNIPVRVFWKDKQLNYLGCNKLFASDAGFRHPEELIGRSDFEMNWKKEADLYRADDRKVIESNQPRLAYEEPQTSAEGKRFWLRTSKIPLRTSNNEVIGVLGTYEDITEQKLAEEDLRIARNAAEAASNAKSVFLANMSHEIRTPMNAILGFTHVLLRKEHTPEQHDKLLHIARAGDHLLSVINNVLDLSKIEAGRMTLTPAEFSLEVFLANIRSMFAERFAAKGIDFRIEVHDVPDLLVGDEVRLSQLVINYLGNALKFTERGNVVLRLQLMKENEGEMLIMFEVQDTGSGIPQDKLGSIFTAFEQVDSSFTRKHGGTGLGLAINRSLAVLMGGDTGVRSTLGLGSTFWFTAQLQNAVKIPARNENRSGKNAADTGNYSGQRILLAEDEPTNQMLVREILSDIPGLVMETADNGAAALEMAGQIRYDAILMDMQMPVMNGMDAARRIRQLPGYETTPILAITGNAFTEDAQRCRDAGMDDFIPKPFTPDELMTALARWLRRSAA